jgi:hypothetical protein
VSGIIPDRLAITNDGNLNYKFTRMGVSSITIHANKNGFNKSSFIVNFTILPQTILIMPQDGVADIDIAINNVGSKQYFAKYYEQGLSGCI